MVLRCRRPLPAAAAAADIIFSVLALAAVLLSGAAEMRGVAGCRQTGTSPCEQRLMSLRRCCRCHLWKSGELAGDRWAIHRCMATTEAEGLERAVRGGMPARLDWTVGRLIIQRSKFLRCYASLSMRAWQSPTFTTALGVHAACIHSFIHSFGHAPCCV